MVRRAERTPHSELAATQQAARASHAQDLHRVGAGQRWQNRWESAGRERLPGARRPDDEQAVPAGRRDLQRIAKVRLTAEIGEVRAGRSRAVQAQLDWLRSRGLLVGPEPLELLEPLERDHPQTLDQRSLGPVGHRHHDRSDAELSRLLGHRERARHPPNRPVERQLPREHHPVELLGAKLLGRGKEPGGDRQVEAGAGLGQIRWSEVRRDPMLGIVEAGVLDRRAHALARLPDGGIGQANERERLQAVAAHVDLDVHLAYLDAEQAECPRRREHGGEDTDQDFACGAPVVPD